MEVLQKEKKPANLEYLHSEAFIHKQRWILPKISTRNWICHHSARLTNDIWRCVTHTERKSTTQKNVKLEKFLVEEQMRFRATWSNIYEKCQHESIIINKNLECKWTNFKTTKSEWLKKLIYMLLTRNIIHQ